VTEYNSPMQMMDYVCYIVQQRAVASADDRKAQSSIAIDKSAFVNDDVPQTNLDRRQSTMIDPPPYPSTVADDITRLVIETVHAQFSGFISYLSRDVAKSIGPSMTPANLILLALKGFQSQLHGIVQTDASEVFSYRFLAHCILKNLESSNYNYFASKLCKEDRDFIFSVTKIAQKRKAKVHECLRIAFPDPNVQSTDDVTGPTLEENLRRAQQQAGHNNPFEFPYLDLDKTSQHLLSLLSSGTFEYDGLRAQPTIQFLSDEVRDKYKRRPSSIAFGCWVRFLDSKALRSLNQMAIS
jgi:hypothetical protein